MNSRTIKLKITKTKIFNQPADLSPKPYSEAQAFLFYRRFASSKMYKRKKKKNQEQDEF